MIVQAMILHVVGLIAVYGVSSGSAAALNRGGTSSIIQPSNNNVSQTRLGGYSPHFGHVLHVSQTPIDAISLMMNGIEALNSLALRDFQAEATNEHFHAATYPRVIIDVILNPNTQIEKTNEMVMSCAHWGLGQLIIDREFVEAYVSCLWDDQAVATVFYEKPQTAAARQNVSGTVGAAAALSNSTTAIINATAANEVVMPAFFIRPDSQTIPLQDVFLMANNVFFGLADRDITETVPMYLEIKGTPGTQVSMLFEPYSIRSRAPYFEYRWLFETVRQMPAWMLARGRFCEVSIGVLVDTVHVGNGLLEKGYASRPNFGEWSVV